MGGLAEQQKQQMTANLFQTFNNLAEKNQSPPTLLVQNFTRSIQDIFELKSVVQLNNCQNIYPHLF